ncbi:MAG: primosomal replication protein N [Pseudomonadota bacterium]
MNRLVLAATLVERGAVRYTPAGLPALDLVLKHESEVSEDGLPRKVSLEIRAVAIGAITRPAGAMVLGAAASFAGFLGATRNGRGLVFHITAIDPV